MKRTIIAVLAFVSVMTFLSGCSWQIGSGPHAATMQPTVGQQLVDLQRAKDAGALTESEYQAQKSKVLSGK